MTILQAIVLGAIQGLTEFLPISSSAHLVLVPTILGWRLDPAYAFVFDVLVQMGTLLALIVYYAATLWRLALAVWQGIRLRRPFADPQARLAWLILLATAPAIIAGLALHNVVESAFSNPTAVSFFMLVTASMMAAGERFGRPERKAESLRWPETLFVGVAQALALFPGISRSGSTISAGLFRGLFRPEAADFSFLMAVPVMVGAGVIGLRDLMNLGSGPANLGPLVAGFVTAAVVGYLAIRWLLRYLAGHRLTIFAWYCLIVGALGLTLSLTLR
jgi:undecaprenyl-diphosphatase